jgi:phosphohistidine swiveling domain-containing protein
MKPDEKFPTTLKELQAELLTHSKDGRSDKLMRVAIATDNFGAFVRYVSHDQELNPAAKVHGTPKTMIDDAGHMIVQCITLALLCDIDLQEAVNSALGGLREKDFIAQRTSAAGAEPSGPVIVGTAAAIGPGKIQARAWVCKEFMVWPSGEWEPKILVCPHVQADARLAQFAGIVTDHGGMNCHAAIIAREHGFACIVGTRDATSRIKTGDMIEMDTYNGWVKKVE